MSNSIMDMIAGAKEGGSKLPHLGNGMGTLVVSAVRTFKGRKGPTCIVEFLVEESAPGSVNAPGTSCSVVRTFVGEHMDFFLTLTKSMLIAIAGSSPDTFAEDLAEASEPSQPLRGWRVRYEASPDKSKGGKDVTNTVWLSYPNTEATVAAGLKALEAKGL